MYQIIQSAKIARCDETGSLGIVVGNEVMPVGSESGSSGGSGLPSGSKPNQYIVTDGEGNAKWEDKLAYTEVGVKELLAETSFTFETDDGYTEFEMPALTIGKKYTVKLNGVGYDLECFDDNGTPTIGAPYGDWSSYPFAICTYEDVAILAVQKAGTYTVSVSCEGETIHKLSGKYVEGMGWSETHLQPLVKNLAYTTEEFDDDCSIYRDNGNNVTFEPNTQYRVEYDGEIYTCITRPIYDYYEPGTQDVLGNAGLSQHHVDGGAVDSGEPFCIQPHSGGWWVGTRTPGKHTFSIWKETETIHPIDKKYLNGAVKSVKWIMPETEVECTSLKYDSNFGEYVYVELADYFPGYLGEQYIVNVNGKDYKAVGFNDGASGSTTVLNGEEFHIFLRDKVWEADGAPGVQITLWGEIVSGPGTYTVSIRQEIENRADRNIFGTVHVAVSKASNHIYRGVLDGTTFDAVYKALESGFVGYFRVRDESDYTAGTVYGPRDLIGNIVEYSMNYIRVKCNDFSFVVTAGNTIESDRIDQVE